MELLERGPYLEELGRLLREAAGHGRLVFLAGEAGVGKSALVAELCRAARGTARVLRGGCDPLSTPPPLGPLVDMAAAAGGELARALAGGAAREAVFRAFLHALDDPRRPQRPALAILEDVHWADAATLDLLRFAGRRVGDTRALIVATYRDDEVGPRHPLRLVLGDLATSAAIRRLALPPLSLEAVRALTAEGDINAVALHRQTGGNPFFVTEVLAAGTPGIPPTVRDAVLARAARLSAPARATLDAAAVIGATVEPALLADVVAEAAAAEECLATGMLRLEGHSYAFRHEIAREAVLAALDPTRRVALNRAVLAALRSFASEPGLLARLAHHAEAAGDRPALLEYAPAAARHASAAGAHREAAAQYARALRFGNTLVAGERATLLELRAQECYFTDQLDTAIALRREAREIRRRSGDRLQEGENLCRLASYSVLAGRNADGEVASLEAIRVLEPLPPGRQLALAYRTQAHLRMLNRDTDRAVEWGRRAIALAERLQDAETLAHAYNVIGSALVVANDLSGREHLEHSREIARQAGLDDHVASAYDNLGSGLGEVYQFALAVPYLVEGIAYCTERDLDFSRSYQTCWLSLCYLYQGRWSEAGEIAASVLRRPSAAAVSRIMALVALGRLRTRRGDPEGATALDEALALAAPTGTLQRLAPVHAARAEAAWLAGARERARAEARAAWELALERRHPWHTGELAYWQWVAGEPIDLPGWAAEPYRLQIGGDWAGAAAEWRRLGCPYEEARALVDGDEGALRQALAICDLLGARPLAEQVARRLRETGARGVRRGPRPSTRANPAGLTRREMEVLLLVAEGLRNAAIAERLYLSPKTVDHHVSALLAKLEAGNRAEAVRKATALGLLEDHP